MKRYLKVNIIGCGVIGAAIAYQVSQDYYNSLNDELHLEINVFDVNSRPAMGATGASLGVLMGACSTKARGDLIALRLLSLGMYDRWIEALQAQTGLQILYNRHGILNLYRSPVMSREQGFALEWLESAQLPNVVAGQAQGGLFSPSDRAVHPLQLVQALVMAASLRGVRFHWDQPVVDIQSFVNESNKSMGASRQVVDEITVVTAGLGANALLAPILERPVLQPVAGQAIRVRLPKLGLQQVIHMEGDLAPEILPDVNIVPLGDDEYWLGATVEFADRLRLGQEDIPVDMPVSMDSMSDLLLRQAIAWCPAFADAQILATWMGARPRPQGAKAPILGALPNCPHILVAIGHYRNGVMMAPVTAKIISDLILQGQCDLPWQQFALR
jgi:glycine/D-amino acid oxidase-like deaminating enzyme